MGSALVIVESPSKARTITKILGRQYTVKSSVGHIRDLPKSKLGVDVENGFEPDYVTLRDKKEILDELKKAAKKADAIYIASDPDREGEAIGWHLSQVLEKVNPNIYRVLFHEITKEAVNRAFEAPLPLDMDRVFAQQARRVLDRLVGYQLSPLLWRSVKKGLSAGRVQSVALRILVEREKEILAFVPEEYWSITAHLAAAKPPVFPAPLVKWRNKKIALKNEDDAKSVLKALEGASYVVEKVDKRKRSKNPPPPFITSTMQQEASRRLSLGAAQTMRLAQSLYEGVEIGAEGPVGLITYMRTDSTRSAEEAIDGARDFIQSAFTKAYLPATPRHYKSSKKAQDAHEAIRPTDVNRTPEKMAPFLDRGQLRLYTLIWNRFVASQMKAAQFESTTVEVKAADGLFRANGQVLLFDGYLKVYGDVEKTGQKKREKDEPEENEGAETPVDLPQVAVGDVLDLKELLPKQHFTKPPARYTEATLIKALEEYGIGRPSTYASILTVITQRDYVTKEKRTLIPSGLGILVSDLLVANFPDVINVGFTAEMESSLDQVEEGKMGWQESVRNFYGPFAQALEKAQSSIKGHKQTMIATEEVCDKCGKPMVRRFGKRGEFLGCSGYPECKNTSELPTAEGEPPRPKVEPEPTDYKCPLCEAPMLKRMGRFGPFLSCSRYPECKGTMPVPLGVACPKEGCDGELVSRRSRKGRTFFGCNRYPKCDYVSWKKPIKRQCEKCGFHFFVRKGNQGKVVCGNPDCGHEVMMEED
jgi:DNA topoisomerase I